MILRAKNQEETLIFELEGHLDFETTEQFRDTCLSLIKKSQKEGVIINLEKLKFVGSTGIHFFIETLKKLNKESKNLKFCNVSNEFLKMFEAFQNTRNPFNVFENEVEALKQKPQIQIEN
jgi:anti-anti-sigma factor